MKFWAAIVEPGQRVKVQIEADKILHLSQASLGEIKKDKSNQHVNLFLHLPNKEDLVLSTLIPDKISQQQLDLIFRDEFEVSHNWKSGTVYFYGYKTLSPFIDEDEEDSESDSESDEENITLVRPDNEGKPDKKTTEVEKPAESKKGKAAAESGAGKQKVKIVEPSPVKSVDDEDDSSETDEDDDDDSDDSEGDSDSDDSEEEEVTPQKKEATPKKGQKRASTSNVETETPQGKKAKLITPQKTESKKSSVHVATPYPKAGKTAAANKGQQTPKSAGSHSCKSCNKTFNSETAIASHNKAKHSAGK